MNETIGAQNDFFTRDTRLKLLQSIALWLMFVQVSLAETATVAVASNFKPTCQQLSQLFQQNSEHKITVASGSTGTLYAQIKHGAPYDVFLSADRERPLLLEKQGLVASNGSFDYAQGSLVLVHPPGTLSINTSRSQLSRWLLESKTRIALANPRTAPYGQAAAAVLSALGLNQSLDARLIHGNNIGQTFQFIVTGNVESGFVALSQIIQYQRTQLNRQQQASSLQHWLVPEALYQPLLQRATLLQKSATNQAALAFMAFLQTPQAQDIILGDGYSIPKSIN